MIVSIHARTRRATASRLPSNRAMRLFQSTPARGGRPDAMAWTSKLRFVSIHARTRRATNAMQWHIAGCYDVSIHARTRRATRVIQQYRIGHVVSIHARTRRATRKAMRRRQERSVSIHARTRRATP